MTNRFRFKGPLTSTGGGGNFQITFDNGYTVSVADTSMSSDFQRIEVAVLKDGKFLTDSMIATPTSVLTLMVETALRPTSKEDEVTDAERFKGIDWERAFDAGFDG